jgi:hypothetical protein
VKEPYQVLGQGVQRKKRMGVFKIGFDQAVPTYTRIERSLFVIGVEHEGLRRSSLLPESTRKT